MRTRQQVTKNELIYRTLWCFKIECTRGKRFVRFPVSHTHHSIRQVQFSFSVSRPSVSRWLRRA
ncbi:hypothetical protein EVA_15711 [gut metagenome]|uniref:Uncharacterized protein n=1 Tax=gut metagenome TaxID=749906 RepID=J9FP00_9ZZZZ